jgi:hypothetical protein
MSHIEAIKLSIASTAWIEKIAMQLIVPLETHWDIVIFTTAALLRERPSCQQFIGDIFKSICDLILRVPRYLLCL